MLHRYVELGGKLLRHSRVYGPYDNELLLGRFLREVRANCVVVATKFGFRIDPDTRAIGWCQQFACKRPEGLRRQPPRLGIERIDLFYQHRVDPQMADRGNGGHDGRPLCAPARSRALGLSEAGPDTLRRARQLVLRLRHCKVSIAVDAGRRKRMASSQPVANCAYGWSHTAHWAGVS